MPDPSNPSNPAADLGDELARARASREAFEREMQATLDHARQSTEAAIADANRQAAAIVAEARARSAPPAPAPEAAPEAAPEKILECTACARPVPLEVKRRGGYSHREARQAGWCVISRGEVLCHGCVLGDTTCLFRQPGAKVTKRAGMGALVEFPDDEEK